MHHTYPLFRPFLFYVSGIAASYGFHCRFSVFPEWRIFVPLILILLLSAAISAHMFFSYRNRFLFGWLLLPLFFCFGWFSVQCRFQEGELIISRETPDSVRCYCAELCGLPELRERTVRLDVRLRAVCSDSVRIPLQEKCRLTLERDSASESLAYGDILWFCAALKPVAPPLNEGEFSYARYLFRRGVVRQGYISAGRWERTGRRGGNPLMRFADGCHRSLFAMLRDSRLDGTAKGLVTTMLLGDDALLDPAVTTAFSKVGVSHILCVSGMHVGILYMIVNYLLFFMERDRRLRQIKSLLHVAVIWGYACMVGLTPSVTRAAVMFTFVAAGGLFRRKTHVYNSLLTSAFLMLLLRPLLLFETGFQMSYLAVLGIVSTQPLLQRLWEPAHRLPRYLRDVCAVSVAAQLFTAPVSLFCFHYFPTWFLISNVVVVTFAPLVIGAALLYLLLSFQPLLADLSAGLLNHIVQILCDVVAAVGGLPGASFGPVAPDGIQLALLYLLLLFTLLWLQRKRVRLLGMAMFCLLLLLADGVVRAAANRSCREIAIYAVPHHYAVEYGDARSTLVFTDALELLQEGRIDYFMQGSRLRHGRPMPVCALQDSLSDNWVKNGGYFQFGPISFLSLNGRFYTDSVCGPVCFPDYLLVGDSTTARPERVLSTISPGCVCALPALSPSRIVRWRDACAMSGIPFVAMGESGMLRLCIDRQ
ncbi:MAG: ComEC family competence protein [Bacteroidales bacterium]|nr:ComEC family competence protein [Bacteroidales bacterium]